MGSVSLSQGGGGRQTEALIRRILGPFGDPGDREDCALLPGGWGVTTDGFTVSPPVFPGGDLGKLCVCGSANDLAVRGVRPEFLTLSVIAEEGLEEEALLAQTESAARTCARGGIRLVAGDTKVVPRGQADGLFLVTTALGRTCRPEAPLGASNLRRGDRLLLTGPPGRHGGVIAACRHGIAVPGLESDCALLWPLLEPLLALKGLRCMRDCTRGGVATVLCEWAEATRLGILAEEEALPRDPGVESVADLLGFDPLTLACEGTALAAVAPEEAQTALELLRRHPLGRDAALVGTVEEDHPGWVGLRTSLGGVRLLDMASGELLPRIC